MTIEELLAQDPRLVRDTVARLKTRGSVLFPKDEVLTGDPGGQKAGMVLSPANVKKMTEALAKINPKNNAELIWEFLKMKYPKLTSLPGTVKTDQEAAFLDMLGRTSGAYSAKDDIAYIFNLFNSKSPQELASTGMHEVTHAFQNLRKGRKQELLVPSQGGTYHSASPKWTVFKSKDPDFSKALDDLAFEKYLSQPVEVQARAAGTVAGNTMEKFLQKVDPRQFLNTADDEIPEWVLQQAGERVRALDRARALRKAEEQYALGRTSQKPDWEMQGWDNYYGKKPYTPVDLRLDFGGKDLEKSNLLKSLLESVGFTDLKLYGSDVPLGGRTTQNKTVFPQWKDMR